MQFEKMPRANARERFNGAVEDKTVRILSPKLAERKACDRLMGSCNFALPCSDAMIRERVVIASRSLRSSRFGMLAHNRNDVSMFVRAFIDLKYN